MGARHQATQRFLSIVTGAVVATTVTAGSPPAPMISTAQIEADWLLQDVTRHLPHSDGKGWGTTVTTRQDAAGGCDGIKDGTFGFHTNRDPNPWWQVDLGKTMPLERVEIYNRCLGNVQHRAARLIVELSLDGQEWQQIYQHDGSDFFGHTDGKPLHVAVDKQPARLVRIRLPAAGYLHLDEVEIFGAGSPQNVALRKPADQSSASQWSINSIGLERVVSAPKYHLQEVVERGLKLAEDLNRRDVDVSEHVKVLRDVAARTNPDPEHRRQLYLKACWEVRTLALKNPLLDFDDLLLVKRVPGTFTHMSDQYYGWFSRPGGGLYVLEGFKTDTPKLRYLTKQMPEGSLLRPDLSPDGRRVLFAHCRHHPGLSEEPNKLDKANLPEDAFYQLYEIGLDGSGLRRLTRGKYDNFDGRYLPDGRIVFLSTRRGQHVQCTSETAAAATEGSAADCYVRCGGGPGRPVAVYTLHVMDGDGSHLQQISPFEMFEWTPSIDDQGRILYARWDYVDRHNMPYMSLWSTLPDGTNPQAVFGNFTRNPHCMFEARCIPGSRKLVFTASGHHAMTGGCLVLLDPSKGADGQGPMTRLTPEVCFPESEGWPSTYFANPYPLAEQHHLVAWSGSPLPPGTPRPQWGMPGPPNDLGIYLFDAFGNLNLIYRDEAISSMYPLPVRARRLPPTIASQLAFDGPQEARMLLINVYQGLESMEPGSIRQLRVVGIPAKTHPTMNSPVMGLTRDDPGKFVLGTVPVEKDGSAYFRVPSGVAFFMQALDEQGMAVQTMRSATYLQPGQQFTCIGCHEQRHTAPPNVLPTAAERPPSKIAAAPEGAWPLDYEVLVQPVVQKHCVRCHKPGGEGSDFDLTPEKSYDTLVDFGTPSLRSHVLARYQEGRSLARACAAKTNPLWKVLDTDHYGARLDATERRRLVVWMDTYGQRRGSFDSGQEQHLRELRRKMAAILAD